MILVPGYSELFNEERKTYDDWLEDIPSEVVLMLFVGLNNELQSPEEEWEKQKRLLNIVTERYTAEHKAILNNAYAPFIRRGIPFQIFSRRYLVPAILKELKRNHQSQNYNTTPEQEFRIFMAYLLVIDELNEEMSNTLDRATKKETTSEYEVLWPTFIDQYEYNHQVDAAFEFVRLLCYCRHTLTHLRPFLKEYLASKGISNLSQFLAANKQIGDTTINYEPDKFFRKFRFIDPSPGVDRTFLESLTINHRIGDVKLTLTDIRKFPLYKTVNNKYIVLDDDFYRRKIYVGPFFEIYYGTSLRQTKNFNQHSSEISKGVVIGK